MAKRTIPTNEALLQIVDAATSTLELDELLKSILVTLKKVTGADAAAILLSEADQIVVMAGIGVGIENEVYTGMHLHSGEGLSGIVFRTGKPLYVKDTLSEPMVTSPLLKESGIRSYLGVPIFHKGDTIGVLHIDWREVHMATSKERSLLAIVADRCGAAIANARQHAELKEAEGRFRNLFDNVSGPVAVMKVIRDGKGRVMDLEVDDLNAVAVRMIRMSREEAVGKSASDLFGRENVDAYIVRANEALASGMGVKFETHFGQSGNHLIMSMFPIGKEIVALVGFDITELKDKEEELAETSSYLENLLDYANAPIIVWDSSLRITKYNHAFEHLTGFHSEEVIGRRLDMLFPDSHRDASMEQIRRTSAGEHWQSVEIPILCADGGVRTVLWNSATIFQPGSRKVLATIAQGQDITERKEAETKLQETRSYLESLIDYANAPIIVWDQDFKIIRFNHAFEHLTGLDASEVIGGRLEMLFPPASSQDSMAQIRRTSTGEHWESVEIPILRIDGKVRLVLWNSATIFFPGTSQVAATIAQGQDITGRKEVERELVRSNAELEQFAYVASHDLREPLRMITNFLELLQARYKGKLGKDADEYIAYASEGAKRMNLLIEDLLQVSRIGRAEWRPAPASMEEVYQQAVENLAAQVTETGATITRGALPTIVVDRMQMTTMLQNLIGNAVKFHGTDPPQVQVAAFREDGMWTFSVKDNGIGIPADCTERIFLMFERLHTRERYPGTGIGLAICKKIVERHGGSIWVESVEGQGSTFYFTVPEM